jgi:hypothetical protein
MRTFKEHLSESIATRKHEFRVKIAGEFSADQETKLKSMLERFQVDTFKKLKTTPVQSLPLDFPQVRNCEVTIFEVIVDYPTTQQELTEYLSAGLQVNPKMLAVVRPGEPSEQYQTPEVQREGALLHDPDYKEAGDPKFDDYYGSKYNSGFVKELNDVLKLQRKARGEIIPEGEVGPIMSNEEMPSKSPIAQTDYDPRKK